MNRTDKISPIFGIPAYPSTSTGPGCRPAPAGCAPAGRASASAAPRCTVTPSPAQLQHQKNYAPYLPAIKSRTGPVVPVDLCGIRCQCFSSSQLWLRFGENTFRQD